MQTVSIGRLFTVLNSAIFSQTLTLYNSLFAISRAVANNTNAVNALSDRLADAIDALEGTVSDKLDAIVGIIESTSATEAQKLAAIEAAIRAQTLSMEQKIILVEAAIRALPDYTDHLNAIIEALNGTIPEDHRNDYIENGVNYGPGIELFGLVWAPVNCGVNENTPLGKYYQWGRKDGLREDFAVIYSQFNNTGSNMPAANTCYATNSPQNDWVTNPSDVFWNAGSPNNPCPEGWRVPTNTEMTQLINDGEWTLSNNEMKVSNGTLSISFPLMGHIEAMHNCRLVQKGSHGLYYTSTAHNGGHAYFVEMKKQPQLDIRMSHGRRKDAGSVRCVKK